MSASGINPLPLVAHLAALALGIWAGFTVINAIGVPEVGAGAAEATQEATGAEEEQAIPEGPGALDARSECLAAVRDAVPPGPMRSLAVAACEEESEPDP